MILLSTTTTRRIREGEIEGLAQELLIPFIRLESDWAQNRGRGGKKGGHNKKEFCLSLEVYPVVGRFVYHQNSKAVYQPPHRRCTVLFSNRGWWSPFCALFIFSSEGGTESVVQTNYT